MKLTSLHLLLTYQCTFECDHCFVWGSPWQTGTMTAQTVRRCLEEARALGTVRSIYFEGGEPFLFYPTLLNAVGMAADMGFKTGIVTNAYWALSLDDALEWLKPFAGKLVDLSISSDLYHSNEKLSSEARNAQSAAKQLGVSAGVISIARQTDGSPPTGQLPRGESAVMYRGRAAEALSPLAEHLPWDSFTECRREDLADPSRVHVDPFGHVHVCQGISIGNLLQTPLDQICDGFSPESHPILGPLLRGGPAGLVREYALPHAGAYGDECHLCYEARRLLRDRFPEVLAPDQMYGAPGGV
jgi:hypothetical protein